MLNDLTLEMCVPSLRCKAAHRMHRKMPSYGICQYRVRDGRIGDGLESMEYSRSSLPILHGRCQYVSRSMRLGLRTWIARAAVCAGAVAGHRLYQLLQCALVTRLLAFVQGRRHGGVS